MKISINPLFDEFYTVLQDELAVTEKHVELRTSGLSTCSALVVVGTDKKLLAHVDAKSSINHLEKALTDHFDLSDPNLKIYVVPGDGGFGTGPELSLNRINQALDHLAISDKMRFMSHFYTDFMKDLVVRDDPSVEPKRIRASETVQKDGLKYVFVTNALPEQIVDLGNGSLQGTFGSGAYAKERVYEKAVIGPAQGGFKGLIGIYEVR